MVLTTPMQPDEHRTITIRYQAESAPGLKFFADQIYTTAVSDWLPCNDLPTERSTLHLTLVAPADMKAAASGQLTTASAGSSDWQTDSPAAPGSVRIRGRAIRQENLGSRWSEAARVGRHPEMYLTRLRRRTVISP